MITEEEIIKIQSDSSLRDSFIQKYTNFILSSARKTAGKYVDKSDDEFSVALAAFNEAITRYEAEKGDFFAFAARVIHSRIIDDMRKTRMAAVPFSSLEQEDEDGSPMRFDAPGKSDIATDIQLEFLSAKDELAKFDISFFDLTKCSPKAKKTKQETFKVIRFLTHDEDALSSVKKRGVLPAGMIFTQTGVSRKILDRHRKYIIATVIILSGDYPSISDYIKNSVEEVRK